MPVGTKKISVLSQHMIRLIGSEIIFLIEIDVLSVCLIYRPARMLSVMSDIARTRIDEFQIALGFDTCIHPMIIRLPQSGRVSPNRIGGKIGLVFGQVDLNLPARAGKQIQHTDKTTHASILIFSGKIIDRSGTVGSMADDSIIGFKTTTRPRTTHGNIPELDDFVVI